MVEIGKYKSLRACLSPAYSDRRGMTLIELLVVILILGALAAIAIPSYLGQRYKAMEGALEASGRGMAADIVIMLEDYRSRRPIVLLSDAGAEMCLEHVTAREMWTCGDNYTTITNVSTYSTWGDVISALPTHYNRGLETISPFDTNPLVSISLNSPAGRVVVINTNDYSAKVLGYNLSSSLFMNIPVASR